MPMSGYCMARKRASQDNRNMRSFDELLAEAQSADVSGWDFDWLDGRAIEERPPWGYARLLAARLPTVRTALDIDTGGGEVLGEIASLPERMCVTESWPPNVHRACELLGPRGVEVHDTREGGALPFPDETFDLVTARHPVRPQWREIHRVLARGGQYLAQHVGPASVVEVIEFFLGPLPNRTSRRHPDLEAAAAEQVGLTITDLRTATCRMEFFDVGAVVYTLRKCVWWIPDFTVQRYLDKLIELDAHIRTDGSFVAHSTRHLIEARR
jgi:SAM-dependent methyltransferase